MVTILVSRFRRGRMWCGVMGKGLVGGIAKVRSLLFYVVVLRFDERCTPSGPNSSLSTRHS